jgi:type IV fimbrial biogenesis protein FimT
MRQRLRGFTLTELMICLALLAILLGLALPGFASIVERVRIINSFHALTASLMSARMAAIARGAPVTVCPSADGRHCRTDLVWDEGWLVYLDPGREGQPGHADAILRHESGPGRGIMIRSTQGRHRVRYQPSGWSGGNNLTLRVCAGPLPRHAGDVIVNLAGRPRSRHIKAPDTPCPIAP